MSGATVQVRFETPEALREEFEKNIANRGVFVATDQPFAHQERVRVEILLTYVSAVEIAHALTGEVVHTIPKEMAASGATPGIAIQFDATASQLVAEFEPLLGQLPADILTMDTEGEARRGAKRGAVRVPVRIMPTTSPPFEATSRDLSASGILLSIAEHPLPLGEVVRVCLWHPTGEPSVEIDGRVVREVKNKRGEVAAVAIAFNEYQVREPGICEVVDALRHAGHHSQLGGISGSLSDLGLANMLQMFSSSAPQGTLVVEHEGEQGWIAFQSDRFLAARAGVAEGRDALVEMLRWGDGQFQFEATVDQSLTLAEDAPPVAGLVLDAVCAVDELNRAADQDVDQDEETASDLSEDLKVDLNAELAKEVVPGQPLVLDPADEDLEEAQVFASDEQGAAVDSDLDLEAELEILEDTSFMVDVEQEEAWGPELQKTDGAVIELAKVGMSLGRMESVIPESAQEIRASVLGLVEMGVLFPNP